jgi:type IV pilus assembly protein PilV
MIADNVLKKVAPFSNSKGFTLIEVLIAMVVFLIGFLAVGAMQISAVNSNTHARMRTEATVLAADVAEQLMALPYDPASGAAGPYGMVDPLDDGTHSVAAAPYTVEWEVTEAASGRTKNIDVTVRWQKKGRNRDVQLSFVTVDAGNFQ